MGHQMQNSLFKLFEHKCVLEVCVHIHPIMIKIHPVFFFLNPCFKIPFLKSNFFFYSRNWMKIYNRLQKNINKEKKIEVRKEEKKTNKGVCSLQ